jgi:hypothetical protein
MSDPIQECIDIAYAALAYSVSEKASAELASMRKVIEAAKRWRKDEKPSKECDCPRCTLIYAVDEYEATL